MTKPPREWWISSAAPNYTTANPQPLDSSWIKVIEHSAYVSAMDQCSLYKSALKNIKIALGNKKEKEAIALIKEIVSYVDNV